MSYTVSFSIPTKALTDLFVRSFIPSSIYPLLPPSLLQAFTYSNHPLSMCIQEAPTAAFILTLPDGIWTRILLQRLSLKHSYCSGWCSTHLSTVVNSVFREYAYWQAYKVKSTFLKEISLWEEGWSWMLPWFWTVIILQQVVGAINTIMIMPYSTFSS